MKRVRKVGARAKAGQPEHRMQVNLFKWAKLAEKGLPEVRWMFAVPNGGARNVIVASKLKAEGVKRGVPDVMLPVSRGGYHGLWIELKAGKNRTSAEQDDWIAALLRAGYLVQVVWDEWQEAQAIIERYLAGNLTREKRPAGADNMGDVRR